ncbi:MAG: hypothetical protein WBZ36_00965, partial [Candidatus Nitrosopolaris sp.]
DVSIENHTMRPLAGQAIQDFEQNGHPIDTGLGLGQDHKALGAPLNRFTNGYSFEGLNNKSSEVIKTKEETVEVANNYTPSTGSRNHVVSPTSTTGQTETVPKKVYPRDPMEDRFDIERKAWEYCGKTQDRFLNQIMEEKLNMKHEERMDERRKQKLSEWQRRLEERESNLNDREARILEAEPYLPVVKKLQEMKLALEHALPWIEAMKEVSQTQNLNLREAALYVAQELRLNRELGGMKKQIESANQELTFIEMATIQKQEALTVLTDLKKKGVTEQQIVQLINFADEWDKYWSTIFQNQSNGNLQQPGFCKGNNPPPNGSCFGYPSSNGNSNNNNGYGGGPSMTDLIRLNLLQNQTTKMLDKMGPR